PLPGRLCRNAQKPIPCHLERSERSCIFSYMRRRGFSRSLSCEVEGARNDNNDTGSGPGGRRPQAFVKSPHCLVYKTVVEGLPHVELSGLGMVDKFQRVRHCSLDHLERGRESTAVVFKATLQKRVIVDSGKSPQCAFGDRGIFSGELLSFVQRT